MDDPFSTTSTNTKLAFSASFWDPCIPEQYIQNWYPWTSEDIGCLLMIKLRPFSLCLKAFYRPDTVFRVDLFKSVYNLCSSQDSYLPVGQIWFAPTPLAVLDAFLCPYEKQRRFHNPSHYLVSKEYTAASDTPLEQTAWPRSYLYIRIRSLDCRIHLLKIKYFCQM